MNFKILLLMSALVLVGLNLYAFESIRSPNNGMALFSYLVIFFSYGMFLLMGIRFMASKKRRGKK